jgi:5-methylcytosine-specific restriction enzyme subunit McrC
MDMSQGRASGRILSHSRFWRFNKSIADAVALLSVQEYGRLQVGEFDPVRRSVSQAQADALTRSKAVYGFDVFQYVDRNTIAARQYVGAFQSGGHTIEVLPKIDDDHFVASRNLVTMLMVALSLDVSEGDVARVATQRQGILEILIRLFCDKLIGQVRRGLVRRYEWQEANLFVLRGKLGIAEQLRANAGHPERMYCRFEEFQEDNALNQVLKAAIQLLLKASRSFENQSRLSELLLAFQGVESIAGRSLPWRKIVFDRISERYRASFKLAKLFLTHSPPDVRGGAAEGVSLFFDMNVLFEEYIGRMVRKTLSPLGWTVQLQGPQQHAAFDEDNRIPAFAMRPDVVASRGLGERWILDTKWKQLSPMEARDGVSQTDMYQMFAYSRCFGCRDVTLLYPHHAGLGEVAGLRRRYLLGSNSHAGDDAEVRRLRVGTISLRDLATVPAQLKNIAAQMHLSEAEIA